MKKSKVEFWDLVKANLGQRDFRWKVIGAFSDEISDISENNHDLEAYISLNVYELFNVLDKRYEKYFKSIND